MIYVKDITPALRDRLKKLFANHTRIDIAIESILEGRRGGLLQLWVNDLTNPQLAKLTHGSFIRFAGEPVEENTALTCVKELKAPFFIQPSPVQWMQLLQKEFGERLKKIRRYPCSGSNLIISHVRALLGESYWKDAVQRLEKRHIKKLYEDEWGKYHFMNCTGPEELIEKGIGYCIEKDGEIVSACSSILVSSRGYEINIITKPAYRRQGMAKAIAAAFILECLTENKEPHWDAANDSSKHLATQLGYACTGDYDVYYVL